MTKIEGAALRLAEFLRRTCPPDDAIGTQDDEWPVSIMVDNEQDAEQLGQLLNDLEAELKREGYMDQAAQTKAFEADLNKLVDRYRAECDFTYASVIGVLFLKTQQLAKEAGEETDDE